MSQVFGDPKRLVNDYMAASHAIGIMQEYRTRLIADVVTGKLDVREVAAQLPDETKDLYDAQESAEEMAIESEVTA